MYNLVVQNLIKPAVRRIGTMLGATLVGLGMATDTAMQIENAAIAALLFAADLVHSYRERR
jgi:hypothetical protein